MMLRAITSLAAALAAVKPVSAACHLPNAVDNGVGGVETHSQLCIPQGAGDWTFSMYLDEVSVPTFDADNPLAGVVSTAYFYIYDESCTRRGAYSMSGHGNDCGIPYVIMENFLPYVLTIENINAAIGGGYFRFLYGNGEFSIGNNHCTCQSMTTGLEAKEGCKCAFPVDGTV